MSLKINAYLRSSLSDDVKDANSILSGEVLILTEALPGVAGVTKLVQSKVNLKTPSPILINQSCSSYTYKDELKIESEGADCLPDVNASHSAPMIQSPNFRSMSPFASESIPNLDSSDSPSPSSDMHSSKPKPRNREKPAGICKVCGDIATGKYFGALVCVPCKTFFLRYNGEGFSFVCKNKQVCDISVSTRIQCKYCRFQKCLSAGMTRKVRPPQVEPKEGKQLCVVCNDFGNGVHFGVVTCEGCKKFFRRGLVEHKTYVCKFSKCCPINPQTRNTCRYCRYNKCKSLGMSREAIQMGRPSKASQKHGILRSTEQQFDDNEDMVDRSNDEESAPSQALDLSITPISSISSFVSQSSPFPATSVGVRRTATDSSETLHFTFLPPSLRQNICLSANEISNQIVPFQLLNDAQQTIFQNLRRQAERNRMNSRNSQSPPKRITMLDLVAMFGEDKINTKLWGSRKSNERTKIKPQESSSCSNYSNEVDDFVIEHKMRTRLNISKSYWLASLSPDENLHVSDEKHLEIINMIVPNYGEFVSSSETINHNLTNNYREWVIQNGQNMNAAVVSEWIKTSVIPAFTIVSVKYCKQIPGFKSFDMTDQVKIACLGQSPSRILAAVLHWFDPVINNFKDFLSWRDRIPGNTDRFKKYLIGFANNVQLLNMDAVEAAILNALIIIASDYPDLIDHKVIESARTQIICTFRAYITVKYGASSDRLDKLFGIIPEIRKIGFFHHEMTNKKTMMAEEFGERLLKSFNL